MTKREIRIKFDQIVDFSGIEQYIDTPVKRYSSGMYVRLAFSVAAHLEPEILIVDEVLAVGDSEFQKKCLGKMQDVSQKEGRTVLFVSHNLSTVENLCKNSILLEKGRLKEFDATSRIIIDYLNNKNEIELNLNDRNDRKGNGLIKFTKINISDSLRKTDKRVFIGSPMEINIELSKHVDIKLLNFKVAIGIDNESGTRITIIDSEVSGINYFEITEKSILIKIVIERLTLFPGKYYYTLFTSLNSDICDWIVNAGSFNVDPGDFYGTGKLPPSNQAKILLDYRFKSND
jgi:lipopolysaccharide transport system ATP-binding protein